MKIKILLTDNYQWKNALFVEAIKLGLNPEAIEQDGSEDILKQHKTLQEYKVPTIPFVALDLKEDLQKVVEDFGFPVILKPRYDKNGENLTIKSRLELSKIIKNIDVKNYFAQKSFDYLKKIVVIAAKGLKNQISLYPIAEYSGKNLSFETLFIPASINSSVKLRIKKLTLDILKRQKDAGIYTINFILTKNSKLFVGGLNKGLTDLGYFTQNCCLTSQFEQHIRAVTGLPLGTTNLVVKSAVMKRILGENSQNINGIEKALAIEGVFVHIYDSKEQTSKSLGHIIAIGPSLTQSYKKAQRAKEYIKVNG